MSRSWPAMTALVAMLGVGCQGTDGDPSRSEPRSSDVQATSDSAMPFAASSSEVPEGFHRAQCADLRSHGGSGLALRLLVPDSYREVGMDGAGCFFRADIDRDFSIGLDPAETLARYREREITPQDGQGGDDGVTDVTYEPDVPVFGDRTGEQLTYRPFNDGLPLEVHVVQADGVRLDWHTPDGRWQQVADDYAAVTASVSVVRSHDATCSSPGETVTYRPPVPQTESIDARVAMCHVYLQPGRGSLLRYAEVDLRPRRSLEQRASRLSGRSNVVSVDLEPGAGRLDGDVVDRLTYVVRRTHRTPDYQPAGTWRLVVLGSDRLQVTWGATPEQWRRERSAYSRFVGSVHAPS